MKKRQHNRGVITVLISLLLVGVLSIGTLAIEAGRYQAAKTQLQESNISAATSMIAAYDADLYARYGLLAIDTERFTPERATDYLNFNADQAIGYRGNRLSRMYAVDSVELTGLYNLTYPAVLKRQILSRAKYHIVPQDYALNVYTVDAFLADFQAKCRYVKNQLARVADYEADLGSLDDIPEDVRIALTAMYTAYANLETYDDACDVTLSGSTVGLLPSTTGTVETPIPAEDLAAIHSALNDATTVLGGAGSALSYNNGTGTYDDFQSSCEASFDYVSDIKNGLKDITSAENVHHYAAELAEATRSLSGLLSLSFEAHLSDQKEEDILLNSYIVEYFSNRTNRINTYSAPAKGTPINGSMENATFASACVEYIFGGTASEQTNQEIAYNFIQGIRLINNLYSVMTESSCFDANNMYSVAAHIAWANYESIVDMELMTTYNTSVPFNKNQMILPINNASEVTAAFSLSDTANALNALGYYDGTSFKIPGSNAFSYKDSLSLGLWFVRNSNKLLRIADLIQLEMRYREQYVENKTATFMMGDQNTYCRIKCIGKFSAVLPMLSLDSGDSARGIEFQSIKYAGY